jgi:hypothetical protein
VASLNHAEDLLQSLSLEVLSREPWVFDDGDRPEFMQFRIRPQAVRLPLDRVSLLCLLLG